MPESATHALRTTLLEYLHRCPICESENIGHYCRVPSLFDEGLFIRYERCGGCDTVFRNPRLPAEQRLERYREKPRESAVLAFDGKSQIHYAYMLKRLVELVPEARGKRLFDFGCGSGGFLVEAREAGFEVMGLELAEDLATHVRETLEIPVHGGLVTDAAFSDERFEVIVSSQVFEHLLDPAQALRDLKKHLVSPGALLIEVPNLRDSRERLRRGRTMDDSHLFYFSRDSLSHMLEKEGFRIVDVEQGLRPWRFLGRKQFDAASPNLLHKIERGLSAVGVRTGLSVLAVLEDVPASSQP